MIVSIDAETVVITFSVIHNKIPECIRYRKIVP